MHLLLYNIASKEVCRLFVAGLIERKHELELTEAAATSGSYAQISNLALSMN